MTPIQFQKQIRLHEARTRLVAKPEDVAGAGFAVGYDSLSQLSREYRRMFGVPPIRDAKSAADIVPLLIELAHCPVVATYYGLANSDMIALL